MPLREIERVSSSGPENYTIYLKDGTTRLVTRAAYSRALRLEQILSEDDVREAVRPIVRSEAPVRADDVGLNG